MGIISELSVVMGTNLYHEIIQISLNIGIVEVLRPDDVRGLSASTNDVRFNMYVSCSLHSHVNIAISSYHSSNDRLSKWVGGIGRDVSSRAARRTWIGDDLEHARDEPILQSCMVGLGRCHVNGEIMGLSIGENRHERRQIEEVRWQV